MSDAVATRIAATFNREFSGSHHTCLQGGSVEPFYEPAAGVRPARIVHTLDYPASALHEAAHWCLAGRERRTLRDYGYWYLPGPRDPQKRSAFFAAETDVQALEALFAQRCGVRFVVSADDFAASPADLERFKSAVEARIAERRRRPLPARAARFVAALCAEFARRDG